MDEEKGRGERRKSRGDEWMKREERGKMRKSRGDEWRGRGEERGGRAKEMNG